MSTENADQRDIIRSIKAESGYAKKWATPYTVGVPDLVCALPSVGLFLMEVKTTEGKLSPKQRYEHEQIRISGGLVVTAIVKRKVWIQIGKEYAAWLPERQVYSPISRLIK